MAGWVERAWWATAAALGRAGVVVAALTVLGGAPSAPGQCQEQWLPGMGVPGVDGPVYAVTSWDPDGPGPLAARLVVAGQFTLAGGVEANGVAIWNGGAWQALGSGVSQTYPWNPAVVLAATVYDGDLVIGGMFSEVDGIGTGCLARLHGSTWQPLATGMYFQEVHALAVYNGELIAGGRINTSASPPAAVNIAHFNGTAWQPLGGGADQTVFALSVYGSELVASGYFTSVGGMPAGFIARWDGSGWRAMGLGLDGGYAYALAEYNGELIAGGNMTRAGGVPVSNIARWSSDAGAWQPVGTGTAGFVYALGTYNGELIAGGAIDAAGGVAANNIARWDGSAWRAAGSGVGDPALPGTLVTAITVWNGSLVACGEFTGAGGATALHVARWTGGAAPWQGFGSGAMYDSSGGVNAFAVHGDRLVAGGTFQSIDGVPAARIAEWDGSAPGAWQPLGSGVGPAGSAVLSLCQYNGDVIAGGSFTTAGGISAAHVARWTGSAWQPLGAGLSGTVRALAVAGGDLFAGGDFVLSGSVACLHVARWDGTAWQPVGAGLNNSVYALAIYGGDLVAGGWFTATGGAPISGVARWTGSAWVSIGPTPGFGASCLAVYSGGLFAGTSGLRRWDGSAWQAVDGISSYDQVRTLTAYGADLVAGGDFERAGSGEVDYIAAWNGTAWRPLGSGANRPVAALLPYRNRLAVGGSFVTAGGLAGPHWALWQGSGPWIAVHPANVPDVCHGQQAAMSIMPAPDQAGLTFVWRHAGQALADGPTGSGSIVAGAATTSLTISNTSAADFGPYDCVVTSSCGSIASNPASFCVAPAITAQPVSIPNVCGGEQAAYTVGLGPCAQDMSCRWLRAGQALSDGPMPTGSVISGATTPTLTITNVSIADAAGYNCVVSSGCASATSTIATLCVRPSIAVQPTGVPLACAGHQVVLGLTLSACEPGALCRWRRGALNLIDGPTGTGSVLAGAATQTLTISNAGGADSGSYDCLAGRCRIGADAGGTADPRS